MGMNADVKAAWQAALRSGDYPQTRGLLNRTMTGANGQPAGHCCLGVLCELAVEAGVAERIQLNPDDDHVGYGNQEDVDFSELPLVVRRWAGLRQSDPSVTTLVTGKEDEVTLAWCNDNGMDFRQIANIIDQL